MGWSEKTFGFGELNDAGRDLLSLLHSHEGVTPSFKKIIINKLVGNTQSLVHALHSCFDVSVKGEQCATLTTVQAT